jgi:hypothetical protein
MYGNTFPKKSAIDDGILQDIKQHLMLEGDKQLLPTGTRCLKLLSRQIMNVRTSSL